MRSSTKKIRRIPCWIANPKQVMTIRTRKMKRKIGFMEMMKQSTKKITKILKIWKLKITTTMTLIITIVRVP